MSDEQKAREIADSVAGYIAEPRRTELAEDIATALRTQAATDRAEIERLTRERDEARADRDRLEQDRGAWTGRPCQTCGGHGQGGDDFDGPCRSCGGTGDEWLTWQERAEAAEAQRDALSAQVKAARNIHGLLVKVAHRDEAGLRLYHGHPTFDALDAALSAESGAERQEPSNG